MKKEDYQNVGIFPIIDQGQAFIGGYTDDENLVVTENLPVIIFGDHTKIFKYVDFPFTIGADGVKVLTLKNKKDNALFYYYFLKSIKIVDKGYSRHFKYLKEKKLPVADYSDQLHIANILSKAESLIAQRKESIRLLDEFLKSTFWELFGNGQNFEWELIEEVASKEKYALSSGPFGSNLTSQHYTDTGVTILRGTNITSGKLDLSNIKYISEEKAIELKRSEVKPNDVVIIAVGSSGKALLIPPTLPRATMSQNFNKITPDKSKVEPIFLEYCINSNIVQSQFRKKITDTVRTFLSLTSIKEIKIPVPPLELQTQFAQIVEKTEVLKTQYQQSLQELENLYGSLSQKAFRGGVGN
ncbi:MAG: restriction endonuclease subunit S [Cyclobacteriaceae bacterium]|nr:restriction endonuclease subunit S [Cyclobacteriaceae bacterium]